jgi:hypothetical protein
MTNRVLSINADQAIGLVGLFLMLAVARLADRGYSVQDTRAGRVFGFLARRAIDGIAVIGWLADHLPQLQSVPADGSRPSHTSYGATAA